ncbi:PIN domain-containing protein [Falsiroseomonas selenitidurans]|uniref:Type II toxin-antitoxin system VapC family toxin n=1 Tax=Falsiroseomonas selenitidurans TaxID=2716335 RepID=A0ABX1E3R1_9PROT|nr:PIN domain-containing protein [Falsiroseomonas selenitidurans]NKC31641.1 type II toxin-antitoxin system VapC family toxin [Falsiroseomonas selenitidurans]
MDTYLLDTNLVSVLYDSGRPNHQAVRSALAALDPNSPQLVSAITIGELRFGLALSRSAGRPLAHIEACIERTEEHPLAEVGRHTAEAFGYVKSSVALQRVDIRRRIPRWVEAWSDRVTGQLLQIDENDLWIAAQAVERNLVVVTSDPDFALVIAPAVRELRVQLV